LETDSKGFNDPRIGPHAEPPDLSSHQRTPPSPFHPHQSKKSIKSPLPPSSLLPSSLFTQTISLTLHTNQAQTKQQIDNHVPKHHNPTQHRRRKLRRMVHCSASDSAQYRRRELWGVVYCSTKCLGPIACKQEGGDVQVWFSDQRYLTRLDTVRRGRMIGVFRHELPRWEVEGCALFSLHGHVYDLLCLYI
jgi:hypothetical protein